MSERRESSGCNQYAQGGFVQCSQVSVVAVRTRRKDSEDMSRCLGHNQERKSIFVSVRDGAERVLKITAESDDLLLQSNDYKVSTENLERKLLE